MSLSGMRQRCWEHDYCAPCFYLITVVTGPRRECLGVLKAGARVELSPLGEVVRDVWRRTSAVYHTVEACECVVMPDHFHGILWVKERLTRPMGHVVKAFKRVSGGECRSKGLLLQPNPGLLLQPNPGLLLQPNPGSVSAAAPAAEPWNPGLLLQPNPGSVSAAAPAAEPSSPAAELWQEGFQDSILLRRGQLKAMVKYIADNPGAWLSSVPTRSCLPS